MTRLLGLCLTAFLLLAGCGEDDDPTRNNDFVPLTGITITSERDQIPAGFSNQFTATGDFSGAFTRDITGEVTWSSSDPGILVFDNPQSGLGRGVAPGTVTVTAERNGVTGTLDFTVSDATLDLITVTPASMDLPKGLTQQFVATGTFSDGSTLAITQDVSWTSGDPAVATVDAGGLATAVAEGTVSISAGFPKDAPVLTGSAQLTVTAATVQSVTIAPADPVITTSETLQFTATTSFSDGTTQDVTTTAAWSSSDTAVATIGAATGLADAGVVGTTDITATFSGITSSSTLTVATLESIAVTSATGTATISLGDPVPTLQLTATGTFTGVAETQDITNRVTWTSLNQEVADVNSNTGLVQGFITGTATIRAAKDGRTGSIAITVQP